TEILPEIRQLQRRTQRIRRSFEPRVIIPGDPQHETSDWVRRSAAIIEQLLPRSVPLRRGILLERADQIVERSDLKIERSNRVRERDDNQVLVIGRRVRRSFGRHRSVEPPAPCVEARLTLGGRQRAFVAIVLLVVAAQLATTLQAYRRRRE